MDAHEINLRQILTLQIDARTSLVILAPADASDLFPLNTSLIVFSALSFLSYGLGYLYSDYLQQEFRRYQLAAYCRWVGALQCAASVGLIVGLSVPWVGQAASGGLALMMVAALGVRIRIKDSVPQMLPALGYLGLNAYLCVAGF